MVNARLLRVSELVYDPYAKQRKAAPDSLWPKPFVANNVITNITVHGKSLRFQFYYENQKMIQKFSSLADVSSEPIFRKEVARAQRQYQLLTDKIDNGELTSELLAMLLPESKFAKDFKGSGLALGTKFEEIARKYIKQLEYRFKRAEISASTLQVAKKMVSAPVLSEPQVQSSIPKLKKNGFNDLIVHKITTNDIRDFVDYLHHDIPRPSGDCGYSKSYVGNLLNYIKQVMNYAVSGNLIKENPAIKVKLDQKARTGKVEDVNLFSPKEREEIIRKAYDINKPYLAELFRFQIFMGLRQSEVLALAWEDISLEERHLTVQRAYTASEYGDTKTELSNRVLGITTQAHKALIAVKEQTFNLEPKLVNVYRAEQGKTVKEELRFVFMNSAEKKGQVAGDPRPWKESTLRKAWDRVKKESGIHKPFSHTRHTFASMLLTKGLDAMDVARLLGHTDDQMVKRRYGTITKQFDQNLHRRAEALLDLVD